MPRPFPTFKSVATTVDVILVAATETVLLTLQDVELDDPNLVVSLHGWVEVGTAVGATTHTLAIRRTNIAGAFVGDVNAIATAASVNVVLDRVGDDTPGDVASQNYVLTITSAAGASTVRASALQAVIHTP